MAPEQWLVPAHLTYPLSETGWGFDHTVNRVIPGRWIPNGAPLDVMTITWKDSNGYLRSSDIVSYPNIDNNGQKIGENGPYQCTTLIAQYLDAIGYPDLALHIPDGKRVSSTVYRSSSNNFTYSTGKSPPSIGSIISMTDDVENHPGHVAIVKGITTINSNTIIATLIENNMTLKKDPTFATNREVTFTRSSDGIWTAQSFSKGLNLYRVTDWATPKNLVL